MCAGHGLGMCTHDVRRPALLKLSKKRERPARSSERGGVLFCPVTQKSSCGSTSDPWRRDPSAGPGHQQEKQMKGQVLNFAKGMQCSIIQWEKTTREREMLVPTAIQLGCDRRRDIEIFRVIHVLSLSLSSPRMKTRVFYILRQ